MGDSDRPADIREWHRRIGLDYIEITPQMLSHLIGEGDMTDAEAEVAMRTKLAGYLLIRGWTESALNDAEISAVLDFAHYAILARDLETLDPIGMAIELLRWDHNYPQVEPDKTKYEFAATFKEQMEQQANAWLMERWRKGERP